MTTTVRKATAEQKGNIAKKLELYIHELEDFLGIDTSEDDITDPHNLDMYWEEDDHHPFLIYLNEECIGFALINKKTKLLTGAHAFNEFFLLKRHRGKGIGKEVALQIFNQFPGEWEIREREKDTSLIHFWRNVIRTYVHNNYSEQYLDGWYVQTFSTANATEEQPSS